MYLLVVRTSFVDAWETLISDDIATILEKLAQGEPLTRSEETSPRPA